MSDELGMFEHADGIRPRLECGYCLDDVARALVVVCRQEPTTPPLAMLASRYFRFVLRAQAADGRCHNRLDRTGRWTDQPDTGDWWGRALWGLGTAAARCSTGWIRVAAKPAFERSAAQRSPHLHSMAFAALGAAEMLTAHPGHGPSLDLLAATAARIGRPDFTRGWPWPQPRLSYANAAISEALLAAGWWLDDAAMVDDALGLLGWLLERETVDGHLSVTPVGGRGEGQRGPAFDQQPLEAAALADACRRAYEMTGDQRWVAGLDLAIGWFLGRNDTGVSLYDAATGGGFDALTPRGPNTNRGAESTLAMVATLQHAARVVQH